MKKTAEFRALSVKELNDTIDATQRELQRLKFAHAVSPLENPRRITVLRKEIATMKTILNEKVAAGLSEKISSGEITPENVYQYLGQEEYPIGLRKSRIKSLFAQFGK